MQDRVTEIEIKLAHAEQSLHELNDVIIRQQQQIDRLERQVATLNDRTQANDAARPNSTVDDEKPPHY